MLFSKCKCDILSGSRESLCTILQSCTERATSSESLYGTSSFLMLLHPKRNHEKMVPWSHFVGSNIRQVVDDTDLELTSFIFL